MRRDQSRIPPAKSQILNPTPEGFTLLELLLVLGILIVLAGFLIVTISPVELFRQARDTRRLADVNQLVTALTLYVNSGQTIDMDGPNYSATSTGSCSDQTQKRIFVSVPIGGEGTPPIVSGWTIARATSTQLRTIDGNGWLPINFSTLSNPPLSALPIDPTNSFTKSLYSSYTCRSNGQFEVTAFLESKKYQFTGSDDKTSNDGGVDPFLYEAGTNLKLDPLSNVGAWSFDEGAGTAANDTSGNGSNGTLTGSVWESSNYCFNKSLTFDGSDDFVSVPDAPLLRPTTSMSVEVWLDPYLMTGTRDIVSKENPSSPIGYRLRASALADKKPEFCLGNGTAMICAASATAMSSNAWYHLVGTFDGGSVRLFVNGEQKAATTFTGSPAHDTTALRIGNWTGAASHYLHATVDEVRVYQRNLLPEEIKNRYQALKNQCKIGTIVFIISFSLPKLFA